MKIIEPGDVFNLTLDLSISFDRCAVIDEEELQVAIELFTRKWIKENYFNETSI